MKTGTRNDISILNAIKAQIVVITSEGSVIGSNQSWNEFIEKWANHFGSHLSGPLNYFNLLGEMVGDKHEHQWLCDKLIEIASGISFELTYDFGFHAENESSWFTLHATKLPDERGVVITHTDITDRVTSEIKLKKNEQEFRSLAENAPNHIVTLDRNLIINYINRDVLGMSSSDLLGKNGAILIDPKNESLIKAELQAVFDTGKSRFYKTKRVLRNGKVLHMGTTVGPIKSPSGFVEGVILIIRDMTDEVASQERVALQNRELIRIDEINKIGLQPDKNVNDLLSTCLHLFPEIVPLTNQRFYLYDPDYEDLIHQLDSLDTNRFIEIGAKLNIDIAKLVPKLKSGSILHNIISDKQLFITNDQDAILDIILEYSEEPTTPEIVRWTKRNLNIKSLVVIPLLLNDSVFGIFILTSDDIINDDAFESLKRFMSGVKSVLLKKYAERELITKEKKYSDLFENINEALLKISTERKIVIANPKFSELLGYSEDEFDSFDCDKVLLDINSVCQPGRSKQAEIELTKKNGERFWAYVNSNYQFDEQGNFTGTIVTIRDITDQKIVDAWSKITADIARKISAEETTVKDIFEHTHRELGAVMPNKNFQATLREDINTVELVYLSDEHEKVETPILRNHGKGFTEYVIETGQPLWLKEKDFDAFMKEHDVVIYASRPKAWISTPIRYDNVVIGAIACCSYDDEKAYTEFHFEILKYVGQHIGIFIDKVEAQQDRDRILNLSQDLICIVNPAGYLRYINPAFENHLGYSSADLQGAMISQIVHPGDTKIESLLKDKIDAGERNFKFERRLLTADGETRYISWTAMAQEKADLFYCIGRDVTEQREIQKRIWESERRYRGIFERMNEGIMHSDLNGVITTVNPGFCKIVGFSEEELIGKCGYDVLHDEATGQKLKQKIKYRESGIPGMYETQFLKKDGKFTWTQISATPHYDQQGNFVGIMSIVMDINERKKAEEAAFAIKEAFTRELENKVTERTMELESARKDLAVSLEKEKELSRLKSRFVSTASHQFRTPLSIIQSNIGILSMQIDNLTDDFKVEDFRPKFDKVHSRIKDQIERMTDLMNDVLILGKINTGNITVRIEEHDLIEVCQNVINGYSEINKEFNIEMLIKGQPKPVLLDKQLFEHAFSNVVSNAIKYSPGEKIPDISVTFDNQDVVISIRDYGIGIPKEELEHLFEPFYRATNTKEFSGTGLGTAIAKEYIELIGGSIRVESELAVGTEFTLTLRNE